ncbi:hypothetical protein [Microbulbifer sp. VAAF005]|uniref:hypothetical protein n=1 Tax=Microbulbifer sp. VAAF005 TaxID=3034230 RepID=UPI0024ACBD5C|nr:hypothetical protein [Microbulbifer sp. VAAF005]WHI46478.1 hypothetical protein P0078_22680 [Microbulbifer sp. VAAF005]
MSSEAPSRELGPQEALFIEMTRLSYGGLQFVSFIKVCKPLSVDILRKGLEYLHRRHPLLRARIQRGEKLHWVCDVDFNDIPLKTCQVSGALNLEDEFKNHGTNCLDSEKYVYSLKLYLDKEGFVKWISVINNHAAFDGRSVMTIFSDLDKFLRSSIDPEETKSLPLQESIASQLKSAGYFGEKEIEHKNMRGFCWPVEKQAAPKERRACAVSYLMPPEKIHKLARWGKDKGIKITAIYCAIASIAARAIPVDKNLTEVILAMDARGLCSPSIPIGHIGAFSETTSLDLPKNIESADVIDVARKLQEQIFSVLLKQSPMTKNLSSDYKMDDITRMASVITNQQKSFPAGIIVSNVGSMRLLADEIQYFEIQKPMITLTNGINPLMAVTYTTYRNAVFVFGYCEPLISRHSIDLFVDEYMRILNNLISSK